MISAIVCGLPGSGKTLCSEYASHKLEISHISTGDLLKKNIELSTNLGQIAKACISKGKLVPDDIVVQMIAERMKHNDCSRGWILDGFPRTEDQVLMLKRRNIVANTLIHLTISEETSVKRITERKFDRSTGKVYYPFLRSETDAEFHDQLIQRSDDTAENILPRIKAYRKYAPSMIAMFTTELETVDASSDPQEVFREVIHILKSKKSKGYLENNQQLGDSHSSDKIQVLKQKHTGDIRKSINFLDGSNMETPEKHYDANKLDIVEEEYLTSDIEILDEIVVNDTGCLARRSLKNLDGDKNSMKSAFLLELVNGIHIIKHGRRGNPHPRTIFGDEQCTKIFWQKVGGKELKPRAENSILINEITSISTGFQTNIFKRSGNKNKIDCCFSLCGSERSLDIECLSEAQKDHLIKGFKSLLP